MSSPGARDLEARGLSAASIRRKLSALSSLFDYLCERNARPRPCQRLHHKSFMTGGNAAGGQPNVPGEVLVTRGG
jgi:hypothetical protein